MSGIFVSYRREDSIFVAGLIRERLEQHFESDIIFTDIDSIPLGVNFQVYIDEQVAKCDVFLVLIGEQWLSVKDGAGRLRLHQPGDFVRTEIESALARNIPVIPLLIGDVKIPAMEDLPETIGELALRNGTPIRPEPTLTSDMDRLISGIKAHISNSNLEPKHLNKNDKDQDVYSIPLEQRHEASRQGSENTRADGVYSFFLHSVKSHFWKISFVVVPVLIGLFLINSNKIVDDIDIGPSASAPDQEDSLPVNPECSKGGPDACVEIHEKEPTDVTRTAAVNREACDKGEAPGCTHLEDMPESGNSASQTSNYNETEKKSTTDNTHASGEEFVKGLIVGQEPNANIRIYKPPPNTRSEIINPANSILSDSNSPLQPVSQNESVVPVKAKVPYQIIDQKVTLVLDKVYSSRGSPSAVRIKILRPHQERIIKQSVKSGSHFDFPYLDGVYRVLVYETNFHDQTAKLVILPM